MVNILKLNAEQTGAYNNIPLNSAEEENDVATWESVLNGIGSGLIKAVGNTVSLGAELIDLGADTNKAAEVEAYFDKINPFDEKAEATTAGKVTEVLSQLAIPGTAGFKLASAGVKGSKMASKAIKAKKNNKYLEKANGKKALEELQKVQKQYNRKSFFAGVAGGTAAEVAVFDEDIGTFGSTFDFGITKLNTDDDLEGRENALQSLVNRSKFGLESIFLTGIIGGVGTTAKLLANHGQQLNLSNNRFFQFINKYIREPFVSTGKKTPEQFELERQAIGKASRSRQEASRAVSNLNRGIDLLFGRWRFTLSAAEKEKRADIIKQVGRTVMSGESKLVKDETGKSILEFGGNIKKPLEGFDKKEVTKLKGLLKGLPGEKYFDQLYGSMYYTRLVADDVRNTFYNTDLVQKAAGPEYKKLVESKIGSFFETAFPLIQTKNLPRFLQYQPTRETIDSVRKELIEVSKTNPNLKLAYDGGMTPEQANFIIEDILKAKDLTLGRFKTQPKVKPDGKLEDDIITKLSKTVESQTDPTKAKTIAKGMDPIEFRRVRPFEDAEILTANFRAPTALSKATLQKEFIGNKNLRKILGDEGDIRIRFFNTLETLTNYNTKLNLGKSLMNAVKKAEEQFGIVGDNVSNILKPNRNLPLGFSSIKNARAILGDEVALDYINVPSFGDTGLQNLLGVAKKTKKGEEAFDPFYNMVFRREVAEELAGTQKWYMKDGVTLSLYRNMLLFPKATSQIAKTVLSPITHARNLISAGAFSAANGVLPLIPVRPGDYAIFAKSLKDTLGPLIGKNKLRAKQTYDEMLELGITNSNVRLGDLSGLLQDLQLGKGILTDRGFGRVLNPFKKFYKKMENLYVAEDDIWKMVNFASERAKLLKAYKGNTSSFRNPFTGAAETLNERAARIVRNTVPNYDYVGSFVRGLRGLPFGNFVSFPAEIIRTGGNIIKQGIDEMIDPATGKISVKSPTFSIGFNRILNSSMVFAGVPYGLYEGMKALHNVTEDEMNALRKIVPDWSKNSVLLPMGRDKNGKLKYIDFSHANAYDTLIRPIQTVRNAIVSGEEDAEKITASLTKGLIEAMSEVAQPFVSESIFFEAANDIISRGGRTRTGKIIYDRDESLGNIVRKVTMHTLATQAPGSVAALERILRATADGERDILKQFDKYGNEYFLRDELPGIAGFRVITADTNRATPYIVTAYRKTIDRAKGPINTLVYRGGEIDPIDLTEAVIEANKRKFRLDREFYQKLEALKTLGVDTAVFEKNFDRIRGQQQKSFLRTGLFNPVKLTAADITAIVTNANQKGFKNPLPTSLTQINKFIGDVTAIPLLEAPLEEATDVDDFINDVRSRNTRESSLIPNVFKQDLNTAMPTNIGNTVTNMNVPYNQMTIAQKIEYDNMVRGR